MAKIQRYEPWGYSDESGYVSKSSQIREVWAEQRALDEKQNKEIAEVQGSAISDVRYNSADKTIEFLNENGEVVGRVSINDIIGDGMVENAYYDSSTEEIVIDFGQNSQGEEVIVRIFIGDLIDLNEFKDGLEVISGSVYVKLDSTSEQVKIDSAGTLANVITVSEDGIKIDNISKAIKVEEDRALAAEANLQNQINELDVTGDTAVSGQYVAAIEETDGIVAVKSRANVSDAPLNGYVKDAQKPASTAVTATDTVNEAISKLEWQASASKTVVIEGTDTASVMTISNSADTTDEHTVYTISLEDVAKASSIGLTTAGTHVTTTGHYTSTATTVVGEIAGLDAKLYEVSGKGVTQITSANASITPTKTTLGDGTQTYDLATDTSKIKLSGYTPSSYATDVELVNGDTVSTALSKLYAISRHQNLRGSNAIGVAQTVDGTTVSLTLDDTTTTTPADAQYVATKGDNVLQIKSNGLYLNAVWDCGEYE